MAAAAGCALASAQAPPQTVEITGSREPVGSTGPVTVLRGERLSGRVEGTLGATLQNELGTANASFGPGVGLPLVRGQGGARVRATVGGLGTHDASTVSADHGVMVEPALAESITVWRGPATIRFGGGAIGGAIEIEDGRVPQQQRAQVESRAVLRAGSGDAALALLRLDGPLPDAGPALVWHLDLHQRRQRTVPISGPAIDDEAVRAQFQRVNTVNTLGRIGNANSGTQGGAVGLGWVGPHHALGVAGSQLRQDYGIPPGGHSHSHPVVPGEPAPGGPDGVRIHARQERVELRFEAEPPAGWWHRGPARPELRLRAVRVRYAHDEIDAGRLSTTFTNDVDELRGEFEQRWSPALSSLWGLQAQQRAFAALGEEAFVPRTRVQGGAVWTVQRLAAAPWTLELGLRAERQHHEPEAGFQVLGQPVDLPARRFWPRSASLSIGHAWGGEDATRPRGGLTLVHWQVGRAPDVQELYAGGPHLATRSFDFGNSALLLETLHAWDLSWVQRVGAWSWRANAFVYRSGDYIYQRSLGWFYESEEQLPQAACAKLDACLPATKREQAAARFFGYEFEITHSGRHGAIEWRAGLFSDLVRGRLASGTDVPRLPPQRYGLSFEAGGEAGRGSLRLTRGRAQTRPGENETPTAAWTRVDTEWRSPWRQGAAAGSWFVIVRNLANRPVRNSTSFLRNYAPEPGRSLEAGLELAL